MSEKNAEARGLLQRQIHELSQVVESAGIEEQRARRKIDRMVEKAAAASESIEELKVALDALGGPLPAEDHESDG